MNRRLLLAAGLLALLPAPAAAQGRGCLPNVVEIRTPAGGFARFRVELALTPAEQARGLMNRESLPEWAGMLFVYPRPQSATFWMKNTLIPLDMIFVGPDGTVRHVHPNAVPLDETPIPGGAGILAVLEINGGQAATLGITPGAVLRHPAFGPGAAWACPG